MSLLFTRDNPETCDRCGHNQFIVSPIVQITKDKHEMSTTGYVIECVNCDSKRIRPKEYFETSKRQLALF